MVKTRTLVLLTCLLSLCGCGPLGRGELAKPDVLQIARGRLGEDVSLVQAGEDLVAVYSDWETTSLYSVQIPVSDRLPSVAPASTMIDRIDLAPPLSSSFGDHAAAAQGDAVAVLYLVHPTEDRMVLKVARHSAGAQSWLVDAVEPAGSPLAVVPAARDRLDLFWSAESLLHAGYPGGQDEPLLSPFTAVRKASTFEEGEQRGMTVFDSISRALVVLRWSGYAYTAARIEGAGPVQSSLLLPDGRLAVLSWAPDTRRLELVFIGPDNSVGQRALVTMCEGTNAVALLPAPSAGAQGASTGLLFLYDDARPLGRGKSLHALSLLSPGGGWTSASRRYRRSILLSGTDPISGFSALEAGGALYALVHQDGLKLLRLSLR